MRVLDAEQFRKTEELESECRTFVSSTFISMSIGATAAGVTLAF